MKIFVTGATGVVGRRAVPLLLGAGHQVTARGRSRERLAELARAGAVTKAIDLLDRDSVAAAMAGHDAVVNLATHVPGAGVRAFLPGAWAENDRVRRAGSAILADAAIALGLGRFVQESFALTYPDSGTRWVDESVPVQPARYNRTVVDAEMSAARVTRSGGVGVALRFALFYYNVVDDEPLTRRTFADAVAAIAGTAPPKLPPSWAAALGGSLGETIARSLRLSNRILRAASTWAPRYPSAREGWRAAYASFTAPTREARGAGAVGAAPS